MWKRWVFGLGCAVVIAACGSKDPNGEDGGPRDASNGARSDAGNGGPRDAGNPPHDAGGQPADGGVGLADGGGVRADAGGDAGGCDGPYLPMAVGNRWTYRVTSPVDGVSTKVQTVDGEQQVGGTGPNADKIAFHTLTTKMSGAGLDKTEGWQDVLADGSVVRYRELTYKAGGNVVNGEEHWDPYKLRIDQSSEHIVAGASWSERYSETKIDNGVPVTAARNDGWMVEGVDVPCGPVGGEMLSCIELRKAADGAETGKTYWFARCVGKVREEGTQTEELTDYELH